MKPIEILQLMNSVLNTLEAYGMVEKNRLKIDMDPSVPVNLYGDPDGIRKVLYMLLSMLSGNLEKKPMHALIGFETLPSTASGLLISFSPVASPIDPEKFRPILEKLSGTLNAENPGKLSIHIPVSREPLDPKKSDTPPCSLDAIIREVQDDETASRILKDYVAHLGNQIIRLENYLAGGNMEGVHREAHSMKGGAMNICAERLQIAAHALETSAKHNRLENGAEMLENIKQAYGEIAAYVSTLPEG